VKSRSTDPKTFDGMKFKDINPSMELPVLINEAVRPNFFIAGSRPVCDYLATVGPASCGLLPANMLVPLENSEKRATYDKVMNWEMTTFSPIAAPVVKKLVPLRRDRSRKYISSANREFHTHYTLLRNVLNRMENVFLGLRTQNGPVPVFLCGVGLPQKPLRIYCAEIY
jgi:glutathione S-transferase